MLQVVIIAWRMMNTIIRIINICSIIAISLRLLLSITRLCLRVRALCTITSLCSIPCRLSCAIVSLSISITCSIIKTLVQLNNISSSSSGSGSSSYHSLRLQVCALRTITSLCSILCRLSCAIVSLYIPITCSIIKTLVQLTISSSSSCHSLLLTWLLIIIRYLVISGHCSIIT